MRIKSSYLVLAFLCTLFACGGSEQEPPRRTDQFLLGSTSTSTSLPAGATEQITNGDFMQGTPGTSATGWNAAGGFVYFYSGSAQLSGLEAKIWQDLTIPADAQTATLKLTWTFDTYAIVASAASSSIKLEVLDATSLALLQTTVSKTGDQYLDPGPYDLSAYKGKKIRLRFTATTVTGGWGTAAYKISSVSLATTQAAPVTIDGKGGQASVSGVRSNFAIQRSATGYTLKNLTTGVNTNYINVTSLRFNDLSVNLQVVDTAQSISSAELTSLIELYVAYFNRVPDADGLNYWIGRYKGGMSLNDIGNAFYNAAISASAVTGYAAAMSNEDFIRVIYKNVLGQTSPEQSGVDYWVNRLKNGTDTRGSAVNIILGAAHGYKSDPQFSWVHQLLVNKATVAYYTAVEQGITYNSADESVTKGVAIAAAVTATATSTATSMIDAALPPRTPTALTATVQAGGSHMFTGAYQGTSFKAIRTGAKGDGTWSIYTGTDTDRYRYTFKEKTGLQEVLGLDSGLRLTVQYVGAERVEYRWYAADRQFLIGAVTYTQNGSWYRGFMDTEAFDSYAALKGVVDITGTINMQAALPKVAMRPARTLRLPSFELISSAHAASSEADDPTQDVGMGSWLDYVYGPAGMVLRSTKALVDAARDAWKRGKDYVHTKQQEAVMRANDKAYADMLNGAEAANGVANMKDFSRATKASTTADSTAAYNATQRETNYMKQSPPTAPAPTQASSCAAPAAQLANGTCVTPEMAGCKASERFVAGICIGDAKLFDGDACTSGGIAGTAQGGVCVTGARVDSVTASSIKLGETTNILVKGLNLANLSVTVADCASVALAGGTNTALSYTCTPASAGSKAGTVKDASGKVLASFTVTVTAPVSAPVVTAVSPLAATAGTLATFTVSGTNLTDGTSFALDGCSGITALAEPSATQRKFSCTPSGSGAKAGTVKDAGATLYSFSVSVSAAASTAPTVSAISPSSTNVNTLTTFTISGANLVSGMVFNLESCSNISELSGGTASERKFSCTPIASGPKTGTIKDKSGGTELYTFHVQVNDATGSTALSGSWIRQPAVTTYVNGKTIYSFAGGPTKGKMVQSFWLQDPESKVIVLDHQISYDFEITSSSKFPTYYFFGLTLTNFNVVSCNTKTMKYEKPTDEIANLYKSALETHQLSLDGSILDPGPFQFTRGGTAPIVTVGAACEK